MNGLGMRPFDFGRDTCTLHDDRVVFLYLRSWLPFMLGLRSAIALDFVGHDI